MSNRAPENITTRPPAIVLSQGSRFGVKESGGRSAQAGSEQGQIQVPAALSLGLFPHLDTQPRFLLVSQAQSRMVLGPALGRAGENLMFMGSSLQVAPGWHPELQP